VTGSVRAFERYGACSRCAYVGGLDDGLCIACQNDPATFTDPVTVLASVVFAEVLSQCAYCGADHAYRGELCERCHREITADTEPAWSERYA
jgi:predicted amidophosphoribosyltransferase